MGDAELYDRVGKEGIGLSLYFLEEGRGVQGSLEQIGQVFLHEGLELIPNCGSGPGPFRLGIGTPLKMTQVFQGLQGDLPGSTLGFATLGAENAAGYR